MIRFIYAKVIQPSSSLRTRIVFSYGSKGDEIPPTLLFETNKHLSLSFTVFCQKRQITIVHVQIRILFKFLQITVESHCMLKLAPGTACIWHNFYV
jgi:hypothetical protein